MCIVKPIADVLGLHFFYCWENAGIYSILYFHTQNVNRSSKRNLLQMIVNFRVLQIDMMNRTQRDFIHSYSYTISNIEHQSWTLLNYVCKPL